MHFARKNIRLPAEEYRGRRLYFLTLCCQDRRPTLAKRETARRLLSQLRQSAAQHGFGVHAYCFMPDHLHILTEGLKAESDLLEFVGAFKQKSAFEHHQQTGERLWQFKFYDHILRRDDQMHGVAWYIWMNPVRKGLCRNPYDFAYSGSFTLPWREQTQPAKAWSPPWATGRGKVPA